MPGKRLAVRDAEGRTEELAYDALIVGTGAVSVRPPIEGLSGADALGPPDGVHVVHSMGDTFQIMQSLAAHGPRSAVVIGAGCIGLEMAEALTTRGLQVTQIEALPEVLPTVDPELGALVHASSKPMASRSSPAPRSPRSPATPPVTPFTYEPPDQTSGPSPAARTSSWSSSAYALTRPSPRPPEPGSA